jgi:hypothetical protein
LTFSRLFLRVQYMLPVQWYVFHGSRWIAHDGRLRIQIDERWLHALDNVISTAGRQQLMTLCSGLEAILKRR